MHDVDVADRKVWAEKALHNMVYWGPQYEHFEKIYIHSLWGSG